MAEITSKRQGELLKGIFQILAENQNGIQALEVLQKLEELVPPTEFENSPYPSTGKRRYRKIVRFSTIAPVKAGWMIKDSGIWQITKEGNKANQEFVDPELLMKEAKKLYRSWKQNKPAIEETGDDSSDEIEHDLTSTFEDVKESADADITSYLATINPYEFQKLVASVLRPLGFFVDWVAPPGRDGGVDIIAHEDRIGASGKRLLVQVKRQPESKVGPDGLKSFMSSLGDRDSGLYVCLAGFTPEAEKSARFDKSTRVTLVDQTKLLRLWIENYEEMTDEERAFLPLKPIYFLTSLGD